MDDLELIKQKINIVDLIQEYLPLKKSGINFKANCPFHQEKTPSFMVSPERGIFKCFGCNLGGDVFKFLMLKEGLDFPEALEVLAKKAGVTLQNQKSKIKDQKERLYEANQKAAQFFNYLLTEHNFGKKALEYLKKRGVVDKIIKEFTLGYAPNSWESLTKFLKKKNFSLAELVEVGLTISSPKGGYDRFRGRIIYPLLNIKNQTVGFAGRILGEGEPALPAGGPKYLNTPTTPLFDKTHFLFGLNLAKGEIRQKNQAILVEGLMDMIMSYQAGVKNVVAVQGTALTLEQIEILKKYTDTALICFDKDIAGDIAARRSIEMLDKAGFNLKIIKIAEGKDPADMVTSDPKIWEKAVSEAEPIYDYYLQSVSLRYKIKTAEGKKRVAEELVPVWSKISDPITFDHYLQKLSALLQISETVLRREIKKQTLTSGVNFESLLEQNKKQPGTLSSVRSRQEILEEYLLALLLKIPTGLTFVPQFPETIFLAENYKAIYILLVLYFEGISFQGEAFDINSFIKKLPDELVPIVDKLYLMEVDDKLINPNHWQSEIKIVVASLKKLLIRASLEKLSADIKNAQVFGKIEQLEILNRRFRDLSLKLKNL